MSWWTSFHTFDGAQGTDLALLLRRLRARLQIPEGHLLCVGTSATLGATADTAPLRRSTLGRCSRRRSLRVQSSSRTDYLPSSSWATRPSNTCCSRGLISVKVLDPTGYLRQEDAVSAWFNVFFPELPAPTDVTDRAWRVSLGERLKRHLLFVNLLKLMKSGVVDYADLLRQMQGPLPADARSYVRQVLDALLVLVSWARSGDGATAICDASAPGVDQGTAPDGRQGGIGFRVGGHARRCRSRQRLREASTCRWCSAASATPRDGCPALRQEAARSR